MEIDSNNNNVAELNLHLFIIFMNTLIVSALKQLIDCSFIACKVYLFHRDPLVNYCIIKPPLCIYIIGQIWSANFSLFKTLSDYYFNE